MQECFAPDCLGSQASSVTVYGTIEAALWAEDIFSLQAARAETTTVGVVAPADTIALLQGLDVWADTLNNTYTLVTEHHVLIFLCLKVLVTII
jgi:hypothetical protein